MPTTTANSVAPSIIAAVMIIAVEIWPAAAGCRAIDSTAEPPIRPMPAAPPMIARPAPIAPPSHAAPWLVRNVACSAALPASCANATDGIASTATATAENPRANRTICFRSIVAVLRLSTARGAAVGPIAIAVTPHGPHPPRTLRAWRFHVLRSSFLMRRRFVPLMLPGVVVVMEHHRHADEERRQEREDEGLQEGHEQFQEVDRDAAGHDQQADA